MDHGKVVEKILESKLGRPRLRWLGDEYGDS